MNIAAGTIKAQAKRIGELEELVEDRTKAVLFYAEREKWIPATERLPEELLKEGDDEKPHTASALVLVAVMDEANRQFVSDDITFDGEWVNFPSPEFEVTHWKPMPKGPEVGHD